MGVIFKIWGLIHINKIKKKTYKSTCLSLYVYIYIYIIHEQPISVILLQFIVWALEFSMNLVQACGQVL